jgi:hypothetical protein
MSAISELAKEKEMSQRNVIRAAVRLYQAAAAGACKVVWPTMFDVVGETGGALEVRHRPVSDLQNAQTLPTPAQDSND